MEEINSNNEIFTNDETQHEGEENFDLDESYDHIIQNIQITNININESSLRKASCGPTDEICAKQREDEFTRDQERQLGVIEKDDYKYVGEILNEMRDGFGICYYKTQKKFIGQWKKDLRCGYGKMIWENGDILQGELYNDVFEGFCENITLEGKSYIKGVLQNGEFQDIIIMKNESRIYEGEATRHSPPDVLNVSFGKLYSLKKPNKYYYGEVLNYKEECGYGLFVKKNSLIYVGEMRKKIFLNYIEMFNIDGSFFFSLIKDGVKHGHFYSLTKDGKVTFGKYKYDYKDGPFVSFSNYLNLQKSSVKMELYHEGFKSKVTDKLDITKRYLSLNYPEYEDILKTNYEETITKLNYIIKEDMPYYLNLIKETPSKKTKKTKTVN